MAVSTRSVDWMGALFRAHVVANPVPASTPCGNCGHRRDYHYAYGPCLVAISGRTGADLPPEAKAGARGPMVSNCPCGVFHRPIGPWLEQGTFISTGAST